MFYLFNSPTTAVVIIVRTNGKRNTDLLRRVRKEGVVAEEGVVLPKKLIAVSTLKVSYARLKALNSPGEGTGPHADVYCRFFFLFYGRVTSGSMLSTVEEVLSGASRRSRFYG